MKKAVYRLNGPIRHSRVMAIATMGRATWRPIM